MGGKGCGAAYVGPCLSRRLDHVKHGDLFVIIFSCQSREYEKLFFFFFAFDLTYLETSSFDLFGQAPQERQVLLFGPRGHAERQRPRRLDKVVREELAEFDGVERLDQLKVAQHRPELRGGVLGRRSEGDCHCCCRCRSRVALL
jgi:hypothetical protein